MKVPKNELTNISHLDKWQHSFAYLTLAVCWLSTFYKKNVKFIIVICCIIFGIIIEVLQQTLTNYRTGDYLDVIANSVGVLVGLLIFNQISKKK